MEHVQNFNVIATYIPEKKWQKITKVSLKYNEIKYFRWLSIFNIYWYKKYYLKITFKNKKVEYISISYENKDVVKSQLIYFNFYISNL